MVQFTSTAGILVDFQRLESAVKDHHLNIVIVYIEATIKELV